MDQTVKDRIIEHSLSFFEKWRDKGLRDQQFYQARDEAILEILGSEGVPNELDEQDILQALQDVVLYTQKSLMDLTSEELKDYVNKRLLTRQRYVAVFPLYDLFGFPDGTQIGPANLLVLASLPARFREALESTWDEEFRTNPDIYAGKKDEFLGRKRDCMFLRTEVQARGMGKAAQKAAQDVEDALSILRSLYNHAFRLRESVILAEDGSMRSRREVSYGSMNYSPSFANVIQFWTQILTKTNPTDLEGRAKSALRLYGLTRTLDRPEIEFILITVGLETLLLGKGDKDYLRQRLAEKAAFLLETDKDARLQLYERVKDIYDRRSGLVHSGLSSVSKSEVREAKEIFLRLLTEVRRLIEEQGFVVMEKAPARKSIDALVEELKFG